MRKCNIWDADNIKHVNADEELFRKKLTIQDVCEVLKNCRSIETVDLSQNRIGDAGLLPLGEVAKTLPHFRKLTLQENGLSLGGYDAIKKLIFGKDHKGTSLTEIDLTNNDSFSWMGPLNGTGLATRLALDIVLALNLKRKRTSGTREFFRDNKNRIQFLRTSQPLTLMLNERTVQ